jgi:hemoglobin/transferrin/lactoferrin receptor protein
MTTTMNAFSAIAHVRADIKTLNGKASNTFTTDLGKFTVGTDFFNDTGKGGRNNFRGTEKADNYGVFTQARLSWTDDLRTSFGGRVDRSKLEGHDGSTHTDAGLSGNANVEYDVTKEVMFYGGYGNTYGGYQLGEIGLFNSAATYNNIETSRSTNYKVGAVYEANKLTLDGNWYWTHVDDAADLGSSDRSHNVDISARGFNITAKYDYGDGFVRGGFATNNLRVNSGYLDSRSADYYGVDTGESITFEVEHTLHDYSLTLGSTNEAMLPDDSQKGVTGSGLDGYFVSNVYAEWLPEGVEGLNLRFDVRNLFDHNYADRSNVSITSSSAATGQTSAFNEPGRSFILTAKYDF